MTVFIDRFRSAYGVEPIRRQLPIAPSTYYAHIHRRKHPEAARCTVARLMKKMALQDGIRGRRLRTTVSSRGAPCPLDHVNRQFRPPRPDVQWVPDFTYVATWAGFVYVAFVIAAYARIAGWRVSRSAYAGFVLDALAQALHDQRPAGSAGDSYDNALAETINGLYKAEVIWRRGPWRSFEAVEYATLEWVGWFNKPPAARANWKHPAGGSRSSILRELDGG